VVVTRLADGAQCLVDAAGCSGELALAPEQLAEAAALLQSGCSGALETLPGSFRPRLRAVAAPADRRCRAYRPGPGGHGGHGWLRSHVIDPRGAFASPERFPGVTLSDEWPDEALARLGLDAATALVALSHDPKLDDPALELALPSKLFYIGALGSRRTHEKRVQRLREAGLGDYIGRIHSPIGLDLGGRAPAEIAVSILAEIIRVRYQGAAA
jgi:xanthine dehydrogenase accessory factor